jgi:hypothetical protein
MPKELSEDLYKQLKQIGIEDVLAHKVSASLDPDYNASKKDVLVMQEAMHQVQTRTDERYHDLQSRTDERYYELKTEMVRGFSDLRHEISDVRTEMGSMHRQYWITFGTLVVSIIAINWYYHL